MSLTGGQKLCGVKKYLFLGVKVLKNYYYSIMWSELREFTMTPFISSIWCVNVSRIKNIFEKTPCVALVCCM